MTAFSITKTVSAPDANGAVTETYDYSDAAIDALNTMGLAGYARLPDAAIDAVTVRGIESYLRSRTAEMIQQEVAPVAAIWAAAIDTQMGAEGGPVTLLPGDGKFARAADGASLSVRDDGKILRNSVLFADFACQVIVVHGTALYAKGHTDNTWYLSVGAGWAVLDMTTADPTVFAVPLPADPEPPA